MRTTSKVLVLAIGLSLSASAARAIVYADGEGEMVDLVGASGSGGNTVYSYNIHLTNTGSTNIGTFWYAWLPPDDYFDFLPTRPLSTASPAGWAASIEGLGGTGLYYSDYSIKWVANSSPLQPGHTLDFGFTSNDDFDTVTGETSLGYPIGYSYLYIGAPETDIGGLITVERGVVAAVPEPAGLAILATTAALTLRRRKRA